jgi:hypothetical protein
MAFMNEHAAGAASRNEPFLILGDFNICDTQDELYYRNMLARLNAVFTVLMNDRAGAPMERISPVNVCLQAATTPAGTRLLSGCRVPAAAHQHGL